MGVPAIFAAVTWVVGDGLLAARVAGLLAVTVTAILLTRFLARTRNETLAGILAGLIYVLYMAKPDGLAASMPRSTSSPTRRARRCARRSSPTFPAPKNRAS